MCGESRLDPESLILSQKFMEGVEGVALCVNDSLIGQLRLIPGVLGLTN